MDLDQCLRHYVRLREELAVASAHWPQNAGKIDRLNVDLVGVERAISDLRSVDEQCGESLFG